MSYLVLARKYRPKNFTEMVGQSHVVRALVNALTQQRLHHAYLFTGTRGVGKTTVSRILAKSLNCQGADGQGGITAEPCGVCDACHDIDAGRFVDYTELDAASNRGVDEVQALLEQAVYKPVQGRFKVFMIDEVHMLTNTAFNAMLKTLEEPPDYLKFVLATTDPQKVPVTVLSRCLQFNLRPMASSVLFDHLTHVLQAEGVPHEAPALRLIARAARGSMRDALSLTDQAMAFGAGHVMLSSVQHMLGSVDRGHVLALIEALAQGDGRQVVQTVDQLRDLGLNAASTLEDMTVVLQHMAVWQAVPAVAEDDSLDEDARAERHLARLMPADETQLLYSMCLHGRAELGLAPDEYAALTMVLLRLLAFKSPQTHHPEAEKKSLKSAESPSPSTPSPTECPVGLPPGRQLPVREVNAKQPFTAQSVSLEPVQAGGAVAVRDPGPSAERLDRPLGSPELVLITTEEGDFWHDVVQQMVAAERITALVRELALQSQLVGRDSQEWLLRIERESLHNPTARERLELALADSGHAVRLSLEVGRVTDSPAKRAAALAAQRQRQAEAIILGDPFVQRMMRQYGAKIVPGSLKPA
ncbi:MAG: DNA polymerase III subunit gamma/tau [Betaproteobacteria bacterium]|nr:DNA polymerase III subunit gamma/tau [Betaproteobacteria bacterium]